MSNKLKPTREMVIRADELNEGGIMIVYKDHNAIRMETMDGEDPFVWRNSNWRRMR